MLDYSVGIIDIIPYWDMYFLFYSDFKGSMLNISKASAAMRTCVGKLRVSGGTVCGTTSAECSGFLRTGAKEWKQGRAQNIFTSFLTFGVTFFCNIKVLFVLCVYAYFVIDFDENYQSTFIKGGLISESFSL